MSTEPSKVVYWRLQRAAGKANHELARIIGSTSQAKRSHDVFVISRDEIERGIFSRLRSQFNLASPVEELRSMFGRVTFVLTDYDDSDENLFEIQPVRNYFTELNRHWPVWLAFSELDSDTLKVMIACIVRDLRSATRDGDASCDVHISRAELNRVFMNAVPLTSAFHQLTGASSKQRRQRMNAVARHLDLT